MRARLVRTRAATQPESLVMPMRLSKLAKLLAPHGVTLETGSRHFKLRRPDGRCYPIAAHNGERSEVPDVYVKGACRFCGVDPGEIL